MFPKVRLFKVRQGNLRKRGHTWTFQNHFPNFRQNKLRMDILRRKSSIAPIMETPIENMAPRTTRSGSFLTPNLVENLKKDQKRFISKGGTPNIFRQNIPKAGLSYFKDIFTTMVDMPWRYTFLAFTASFFISWLIFTILYYIIAIYRGDLIPENLPSGSNYVSNGGNHTPCVWACEDFTSYYLFSMETQHTIG